MPLFTLDELEATTATVRALVPPTPAYAWPLLAERTGAEVIVKHENHTPTGSFKARGMLVYIEGRISTRSYEAKDGSGKRYTTDIVAQRVQFLGGRPGAGSEEPPESSGGSGGAGESPPPMDDEDIPF